MSLLSMIFGKKKPAVDHAELGRIRSRMERTVRKCQMLIENGERNLRNAELLANHSDSPANTPEVWRNLMESDRVVLAHAEEVIRRCDNGDLCGAKAELTRMDDSMEMLNYGHETYLEDVK